jgi:hypothetical protein
MKAALILSLIATMVGEAAAKPSATPKLIGIDGRCGRLTIYSADASAKCKGKMIGTSYSDGRAGFYFVTSDGQTITFSGDGKQQIMKNADKAVQPVDRIIFGAPGNSRPIKAVGTCTFSNPYAGAGTVVCDAETAEGTFNGSFVTNGQKPEALN